MSDKFEVFLLVKLKEEWIGRFTRNSLHEKLTGMNHFRTRDQVKWSAKDPQEWRWSPPMEKPDAESNLIARLQICCYILGFLGLVTLPITQIYDWLDDDIEDTDVNAVHYILLTVSMLGSMMLIVCASKFKYLRWYMVATLLWAVAQGSFVAIVMLNDGETQVVLVRGWGALLSAASLPLTAKLYQAVTKKTNHKQNSKKDLRGK